MRIPPPPLLPLPQTAGTALPDGLEVWGRGPQGTVERRSPGILPWESPGGAVLAPPGAGACPEETEGLSALERRPC
jgi:hypothetical protein